ncbi:MAG: sulfatase [Marinilabiliaceae bacterium]|nr:sulfatase [Marinilabiliaceae bacterium]
MNSKLKSIILGLTTTISLAGTAQEKPNVLFIAIDDLKPMMGAYGHDFMQTPHMDDLANGGVLFTNAHCQQAVCGPSRASLLTGMRPDYTGVRDLKTRMRDVNPDILSLPQHFKANGYTTVAVGKIYDPRCVGKQYDGPSWSIPYSESSKYEYPKEYGEPALSYYALEESKAIVHKLEAEARAKGEKNIHGYVSKRHKPSVECADVRDEAYIDGQICNNALRYMKDLSREKEPFFLAVGFKRPHLPFAAPKKYWDLYQREDVKLADYQKAVKNGVNIAYHNSGELQSYTDIPALASFTDINTLLLPADKQRELIHGYCASTSFVDAQVGKLMDQLKEQGLDKNTIVVLWGDHGWHLGDHNLWCKHSNFEQATRVPFIISAPGFEAGEYKLPAEFIDIFPTLCDLSAIEIPAHLQGTSLVPALKDNDAWVKPCAVSQFGRGKKVGYSIRNDRFRLTLWMKDGYKTYEPFSENVIVAGELYDYQVDADETTNFYEAKKYAKIRSQLMTIFKDFVAGQNEELKYSGGNPNQEKKAATVIEQKGSQDALMDLSFLPELADNWDVISRKGADALFEVRNDRLTMQVNKLGEKPWDLQLAHKNNLSLQAGQTLKVTFFYRGHDMKMNLGPVNGKRIGMKIPASKGKKPVSLLFPIEATGDYPCKLSFTATGLHEIWDLTTEIK